MKQQIIQKAKEIAHIAHKGQLRKDGVTPYIKHPELVVNLLLSIGIKDEDIICAAWLHDVIEDCGLIKEFIEGEFNSNIARIVAALTRDCSREKYNERIRNADFAVKIIKLADVIPEKLIFRKIEDCEKIYLDLAKQISFTFYKLLLVYYSRIIELRVNPNSNINRFSLSNFQWLNQKQLKGGIKNVSRI